MKIPNFLKVLHIGHVIKLKFKNYYQSWQTIYSIRMFRIQKSFTILNSKDSINQILTTRASISRFGDGEFLIMQGGSSRFQDANTLLAKRLYEVLNSVGSQSKHIVCLPYPLENYNDMVGRAKFFWQNYIAENRKFLLSIIPPKKIYCDSSFTRFYIDFLDEKRARFQLNKIMQIWEGRDVVIVEGTGTRMGINNDLLKNTNSIRRIVCPSRNAYDVYNEILSFICDNINKESLILCALGMTATVLAYDLSKQGYQAIDIGHVDIEYEWFIMKAQNKCLIKGKAVNECGENNPEDIDSSYYRKQIIQTIVKK